MLSDRKLDVRRNMVHILSSCLRPQVKLSRALLIYSEKTSSVDSSMISLLPSRCTCKKEENVFGTSLYIEINSLVEGREKCKGKGDTLITVM